MQFSSICQTFAYDCRQYLVPATCIVAPIAVGIIDFSSRCYHDPDLLQRKWKNLKDTLLHTFYPKAEESKEEFNKRIFDNFIKTTIAIIGISVTVWACSQVLPLLITSMKIKSIWCLYDLLPNQTSLVVKLEYFSLGLLHGAIALKKFKCANKASAMFHLSAALSAIAFPYIHIAQGEKLRLHHSFIGIAMQLAPFKTVKTIGTFIAIDSTLYSFAPYRGYFDRWQNFKSYDYMNVIVEDFPNFIKSIFGISLLETLAE